MSCVRCVRELGWSWVRGGTTEEKEEKARNASLKQKPHTEMWGKNPHSDELCDEVKKKQQQEESCYRDTMTKSNKSNVHRRPTSDVHKRPTFDVHRRPLNPSFQGDMLSNITKPGMAYQTHPEEWMTQWQTIDLWSVSPCWIRKSKHRVPLDLMLHHHYFHYINTLIPLNCHKTLPSNGIRKWPLNVSPNFQTVKFGLKNGQATSRQPRPRRKPSTNGWI